MRTKKVKTEFGDSHWEPFGWHCLYCGETTLWGKTTNLSLIICPLCDTCFVIVEITKEDLLLKLKLLQNN